MPTNTLVKPSSYKNLIRPILFIVGLLFFTFLVNRSWPEIQQIFTTLNWPLFALSVLMAVLDNFLFSILFRDLLTKYGLQIDYPRIGQMYFYGQVAKYIPGRIWSVLYQATFLNQQGATSATLFANLDLTAAVILRNIAIALAIIVFYWHSWLTSLIFIGGVAIFWYFCQSCWVSRFFQVLTQKFQFISTYLMPCTPNPKHQTILLVGTISWGTYLLANFLLLEAAFDFSINQAALYIAYFSLAWVVGVISIVMPAGLGIREFVFILLSQTITNQQAISIEMVVSIAVVYRFWHIILEVFGMGIGFGLSFFKK